MSSKEVCIICDFQENLWQFYIRQDGAFVYRIMYSENKWTKENKLDSNVEEFYIGLDNEYNFHIIYITSIGELKYCIYKNQQWSGKKLYSYDRSRFYTRELGLELIDNEIHIVFILCKCGQTEKGKLMHYVWRGEEGVTSNIYTIELLPSTERHYSLEMASESVLYLFFLTRENSEASLMNCGYINGTWSQPKKLYGITGDNIEIFTLESDNEFNILNVSKEGSTVLLERAFIDYQGTIQSEIIYESTEKVNGANFFMYDKTLWVQWIEGDSLIKYTYLDGKWKIPESLYEGISNIQIYKYKKLKTPENTFNIKVLFGSAYPDIQFYVPKCLEKKEFEKSQELLVEEDELSRNNYDSNSNSKAERRDDNNSIKILQKRIATLQMQLQLKERTIEEAIETDNRLIEQKRISEEKSDFFSKLQQETKKRLDNAVLQLKDERKAVEEMKDIIESLNKELYANGEKLSAFINDNELMKKEVLKLTQENDLLIKELREERNKSIFAKILKKSD
jgi:hypothetical protein